MRSLADPTSSRSKRLVQRATAILLGLVAGVLLAELILRAGGALLLHQQQRRNLTALRRQRDMTILCLGESTTAGEPGTGGYPAILQELLNGAGLDLRFAVVNEGLSGASSSQLVGRLEEALARVRPDLVVTMIGINDAGRTLAWRTLLEPGAGRWYGEWRLYKLWRLARSRGHRTAAARATASPTARRAVLDFPITPRAATPTPISQPVHERLESVRAMLSADDLVAADAALGELRSAFPDLAELAVLEADLLRRRGDAEAAHARLRAAHDEFPGAPVSLYAALAESHAARGEYREAIELMRYLYSVLLKPENRHETTHYAIWLARLHEGSGDLAGAEEIYRAVADEIGAGDELSRDPLIDFYRRHGRHAAAEAEVAEQRRLRRDFVNPVTRRNYQTIRRMLQEAGIDWIAVQYPTRPLASLEAMLGDVADVVTVDNSAFAELVARDGYARYFRDRFAGDFGHLTEWGDCVLATRVADAIVRRHLGSERAGAADLARAADTGTCALPRLQP